MENKKKQSFFDIGQWAGNRRFLLYAKYHIRK